MIRLAEEKQRLREKMKEAGLQHTTRNIILRCAPGFATLASFLSLYINGNDTNMTAPESVLMFNINSAVASYERSRVIERCLRGKEEWRDKGVLKFSVIYGYDNKYLPDGEK